MLLRIQHKINPRNSTCCYKIEFFNSNKMLPFIKLCKFEVDLNFKIENFRGIIDFF